MGGKDTKAEFEMLTLEIREERYALLQKNVNSPVLGGRGRLGEVNGGSRGHT